MWDRRGGSSDPPHLKSAAIAAALFLFLACSSGSSAPPRIELNTATDRATVDVIGLSADQLQALGGERSRDEWLAIFNIRVAEGANQPMVGSYAVDGLRLRFTPMFPLDPGRSYDATFMMPGGATSVSRRIALPARDATPATVVAQVYPSFDIVPENQLRLYIHFSAPMGLKGGLDYVHLLDDAGNEVKDPFLPLDTEFWNDDRTRYTVFFDPGRQKRGIPVIEGMGRSLTEGKAYTLVVDAAWRDGNGLPLKAPFRRTFRVGPPDERPLDHTAWDLKAPRAGSRDPLTVAFREPLDHGLLLRALGVAAPDGKPIAGDVAVGKGEVSWSFTPKAAWQAGTHHLVAFAMLEDLAGNRVGRAFEVDQFDRSDRSAEVEKTLIPFGVK
jgi:hypothetical protein